MVSRVGPDAAIPDEREHRSATEYTVLRAIPALSVSSGKAFRIGRTAASRAGLVSCTDQLLDMGITTLVFASVATIVNVDTVTTIVKVNPDVSNVFDAFAT